MCAFESILNICTESIESGISQHKNCAEGEDTRHIDDHIVGRLELPEPFQRRHMIPEINWRNCRVPKLLYEPDDDISITIPRRVVARQPCEDLNHPLRAACHKGCNLSLRLPSDGGRNRFVDYHSKLLWRVVFYRFRHTYYPSFYRQYLG